MGMDVAFGLMYGVNVWETILDAKKGRIVREEIPQFDVNTGLPTAPKIVNRHNYPLKLEVPGLGKEGEFISDKKVEDFIDARKQEFGQEDGRGDFIYSYDYIRFFGFKAFAGEEPYEMPQDMCVEFVDESERAKFLWERYFPYIPGKLMLYMRVSV